jgi:hypothetical protein
MMLTLAQGARHVRPGDESAEIKKKKNFFFGQQKASFVFPARAFSTDQEG